jgi:hypothetical protein
MNDVNEKIINCSQFEEHLTDYLDNALDRRMKVAMAEHALQCPLCHALLNEVKTALEVCQEISAPKRSMTHLEARILSMTVPETAMACREFENHLTDYLDGFLPAAVFHRWERHAVLCENCTDLPGEVVRSIAACYTYKTEELPVPEGLHAKILQATIGTERAGDVRASWISQAIEWIRGLSFPIPIPQLAPGRNDFDVSRCSSSINRFPLTVRSARCIKEVSSSPDRLISRSRDCFRRGKDRAEIESEPINGTYINNKEGNN